MYKQVKQEWLEQFAEPVIAKRNWQIVSGSLILVVLLLGVNNYILINKAQVIPYIVEVDHLGRAQFVDKLQSSNIVDETVIRAFLYRYIDLARSVITDDLVMKKNFSEVYSVSGINVQNNFLNGYYSAHDPFKIAQERTLQIIPSSFLKQSDRSFLMEWKEVARDLSGKIVKEEQWQAWFEVAVIPPKDASILEKYPLNPFGIYVNRLSWSQIDATSKEKI
ncbi:MAG: type IV secretion system protein [Candidatus Omnitrophica bacterium]|nr:type IV secretion system protein [Candidatus Omnitrophota bacterium]